MNNWRKTYPQLDARGDNAINALMDGAMTVNLPAGSTAFRQGDACSNYLLILHGVIKVMTRAENGREIVLYRLGDGDSCVLTTSCLFGSAHYPAEGIAETDVSALAIPARNFHQALKDSEVFREFVFGSFSSHLSGLIELVEEVAFGRLDSRLARHLLKQFEVSPIFQITHQQLATELGTAREVISRQLKDMESRGWLTLNRGSIELLDKVALKKLATE